MGAFRKILMYKIAVMAMALAAVVLTGSVVLMTGDYHPFSATDGKAAQIAQGHALYGVHDKLAVAEQLRAQLRLEWRELAVIGDDWPDLPLLLRAGFACAPPNAHAEVKAVVRHVTAAAGGHGAAREFCDLLLCAAGRYAALLNGPLTTLDDA